MNEHDDDPPPHGYVEPSSVWLVEYVDPREPDGPSAQIAGFTTEAEARKCQQRLVEEGFFVPTYLNLVPIHRRLEDWHWDR